MLDAAKFLQDFSALCKEHGVVDFAYVVRELSGNSSFTWFAGETPTADNQIANRNRAAMMHFELIGLASHIEQQTWNPSFRPVTQPIMGQEGDEP